MSDTPVPVQVNRAPVLTLWAAVVAERLGHPPDTALTLGRTVAGSSARSKARRLGIADESHDKEERNARAAGLKPDHEAVRLLGRDIVVVRTKDGSLRAETAGKPSSAVSVRTYLTRSFGDRLGEVRAEMMALAETLPPDELNRMGFRLYEHFRPEVPRGVEGWGAKGQLHLDRIRSAAG